MMTDMYTTPLKAQNTLTGTTNQLTTTILTITMIMITIMIIPMDMTMEIMAM